MSTVSLLSMDDAVVPSRSRTPLSMATASLSHFHTPGSSGSFGQLGTMEELRALMEYEWQEAEAIWLGMRLRSIVNRHSIDQTIEAMRSIFVGWRISSIVKTFLILDLPSRIEACLLLGLTDDWLPIHVAELMALMYFMPGRPVGRRKIALAALKRMEKSKSLEIVAQLYCLIEVSVR